MLIDCSYMQNGNGMVNSMQCILFRQNIIELSLFLWHILYMWVRVYFRKIKGKGVLSPSPWDWSPPPWICIRGTFLLANAARLSKMYHMIWTSLSLKMRDLVIFWGVGTRFAWNQAESWMVGTCRYEMPSGMVGSSWSTSCKKIVCS